MSFESSETTGNSASPVDPSDSSPVPNDEELADRKAILQRLRIQLLQQILAHGDGMLSVEELAYRNPEEDEQNVRYHLRELKNRGIVEDRKVPTGKRRGDLPNTFYTVTQRGIDLLKSMNLYEEIAVWRDVYDRMERTERIETIERMDRPTGDEH